MLLSPTIVLALLFVAGSVFVFARRIQRRVGVPWSDEIHADVVGALPQVPLLIDDELQLIGKPDYIVRRGRDLIPVEVKPLRRAKRPYESDIYQLMAYCLLMERTYGQRPPYGLLRYATHTFRIDYDDDMAATVIDVVTHMHALHDAVDVPRQHNSITRCRGCGFWQQCDQSLVLREE